MKKVLISVKDSGIGIPAESIKKSGTAFYKTIFPGKVKQGNGLDLLL